MVQNCDGTLAVVGGSVDIERTLDHTLCHLRVS
jgi:hypothetical protein